KIQEETGATFLIITHNIASVMRTSDYIAVLYQANLVKFASKEEMRTTDNPLIRQFLAGRAMGPIGMDELADERTEVEKDLMDRERRRLEAEGRDVDDYGVMTV
ncbi:MAG TPA: hypothetical protein VFV42_04605, partial [Acidimicrobiales bacterium]|nr:hypothetical protein [Acidimicrobiales bacterium]